ncbi:MAG: M14 family metallopeptidase, partial [Gemmatimonadaceae bacterium]
PRIDPTRISVRAPVTRAEASNYTQTSTYGDVMAFINALRARSSSPSNSLAFGTIGKTTEGRDIPYIIASRPMVSTPEQARALGRPVVYVNANIHAGEVEGKEALLALVRDLAAESGLNVLDSIVLVAVPIYNADGNEKFKPQSINRTEQNGPELVGQRANAQGLDLNRDYIKAEAPETRAALAMFDAWDPDVYVDLHTTDGSYHGYALTYSPSLNPAAYQRGFAGALTRDTMLPELRAAMHRHGFEVFDYGNFDSANEERDITDTVKHGWYTYDHRPRFGTNYYGLRDRVSILSEAYSHDPFKRRVASTYAYVREILSATARHRSSMARLRQAAGDTIDVGGNTVPVRAQLTTHPFNAPVTFEILRRTGDSTVTQPGVPPGIRRTGRYVTQVMPVYDRFEPSLNVTRQRGYWIPQEYDQVLDNLRQHGVRITPISAILPPGAHLQEFLIDSVSHTTRPFQGHRETCVTGHWRTAAPHSGRGFVVSADGRLGFLAAYLLEPESDDGLLDWNFFDSALAPGKPYPVLRITP